MKGRGDWMTSAPYVARKFALSGVVGISDQTLDIHFKLYEGYVAQTNHLTAKLSDLTQSGPIDQEKMAAYSELTRRLGFEYNGMILHEYYFDNLKKGGSSEPNPNSTFARCVQASHGSYEAWKSDFVTIGKMRGVGWAVCYQNPATGRLSNHWITLHEEGNIAGFTPVLVMDVWEHAFLLDYKPAERPKYIEAFIANVDWQMVEARLRK